MGVWQVAAAAAENAQVEIGFRKADGTKPIAAGTTSKVAMPAVEMTAKTAEAQGTTRSRRPKAPVAATDGGPSSTASETPSSSSSSSSRPTTEDKKKKKKKK